LLAGVKPDAVTKVAAHLDTCAIPLGAPASRRPVRSRKPELAGGTPALPGTVPLNRCWRVAQTSKSAVSRVSKPAVRATSCACRLGSRRPAPKAFGVHRFGNLRYQEVLGQGVISIRWGCQDAQFPLPPACRRLIHFAVADFTFWLANPKCHFSRTDPFGS
jgi:hypothetical protein